MYRDQDITSPVPPSTEPGKWLIRIVSIMWGIAVPPVAFMAMMSVMLFDAPGSEKSLLTILLAFSIMTAPLVLLLSCIGGLVISFVKDFKPLLAKVFMVLPLINVALFTVAWILIDMVCDGELSCY